jgi:iron complex outermembrane receptor protein
VLGNELLTVPDLKLNRRAILGNRLGYRLQQNQLSYGLWLLLFTNLSLAWTRFCFADDTFPVPRLPESAIHEAKQDLVYLREEQIVISNAQLQPLSQSPSNVFVVTAEEIRQSGATDLPTILRRVPGLSVIQLSGFEFAVSARGDNQTFANTLLLMIDGRSVYEDTQGNINWLLLPISFPKSSGSKCSKVPRRRSTDSTPSTAS